MRDWKHKMTDQEQKQFLKELTALLYHHSMDTITNVPSIILARTIFNQLEVLAILQWEVKFGVEYEEGETE